MACTALSLVLVVVILCLGDPSWDAAAEGLQAGPDLIEVGSLEGALLVDQSLGELQLPRG